MKESIQELKRRIGIPNLRWWMLSFLILAEAITGLASSTGALIFLRVLLGTLEGPVQVGMNTSMTKWLRREERGRGSTLIDGGLYWSVPPMLAEEGHVGRLSGAMNFAGNVAGIAIPIVVGWIFTVTNSFSGVFLLFGICGLVMAGASVVLDYSRTLSR